ncbi:MAG: class I mannose-6-phosphate isomerase [Planctomycetota bacterium]
MITQAFQSTALPADWRPNYDREPVVPVPGHADGLSLGWDTIAERLTATGVLSIDCYDAVDDVVIAKELNRRLGFDRVIHTASLMKTPAEIDTMLERWLGGDDPVFGFLCSVELAEFFDPAKLDAARRDCGGKTLVIGPGAALVNPGDVAVLADMPRWEVQARQRAGTAGNLGADNAGHKASLLYKRSYFIDWRALDRHKKPLLDRCDFFLDTTVPDTPKLAAGDAVREGLEHCTTRPFRVVPFFDPGPWGGQWMREVCRLEDYRDDDPPNYAWCFDCVPEENSLRLGFGEDYIELPSVNALFRHPAALLGDPVHARFGDEFPIRFDFLDTMEGGNLSFQVHPLTEFIQQHFGMHYTQDESYYLLDASEDGTCYLGVKPGVDPEEFGAALAEAQAGGAPFDADRFANVFPAKPHDHLLIPAGTVHCSGRNTMVLEISATPYIFTFKLWDWGRLGLDGKPRPINIERGMANLDFGRDTAFCERELVNAIEPIAEGDGWREERTGLHRREFIETRRHWFTKAVEHDTGNVETGGVHVLNLVQGREAVVESPTGAFEPFVVHYAETWIVPAAVGRYTVRPLGEGEHATVCASVRTGL